MKETVRTLSFVGAAVVSAALAWYVSAGSKPAEAEAFAKVGTEFYPEFTDPTQAGSLEITSYDQTTREVQKFKVELDRGRWRIPSHHGYPADAKDQLEKAAASLIGITRQALAGRRSNAHDRFGVLQPPETEPVTDEPLDGLGQRIVLRDKAGNVLADFILGKRVAGQDNLYFVRTPGEDETYHAEIAIDVSTKFGEWVEKDLLKLNRDSLVSMEYSSIEELRQIETPSGRVLVVPVKQTATVGRDETGPGSKWQVEDLNPETEEINTSGVSDVQTALDSLELNGVRPKLQGLTADLTVDIELFPKNQNPNNYFNRLQSELSNRGFLLAPSLEETEEEKFSLFGRGGELIAKTNEGLVYHMLFGEAFAGTEKDIEVGKTEVADEEGKAVTEEDSESETAGKFKTTQNRYLFIRVEFDESLLGGAPTKPEEPQKPEGLDEDKPSQPAPQDEKDAEKSPKELQKEQQQRDYEAKLALYRNQLAAYEEDAKDYENKLKAGQAKAEELNNRFREWYYVIPAESYDNLTFTRADVVKEKEKEEPQDSEKPSDSTNPPSSTLRNALSDLEKLVKGQAEGAKAQDVAKPAVAEKPNTELEPAKEEKQPPTEAQNQETPATNDEDVPDRE